jgi:GDP-4-dehydro-6-deoxy-D-mannose reductase
MAVWVVTGGSGFLGRHLLEALVALAPHDVEIACVGRTRPLEPWPGQRFVQADLRFVEALRSAMAELAPEVVFHLAGQTPPAAPERYYQGNTLATANLLEALAAKEHPVRLIVAGSAAELGRAALAAEPIGETTRCLPFEPYGLSKWSATAAALRARPHIEPIVARIFNPIGPGMPPSLAFGRFAARLAQASHDPVRLRVGDLESRRDFIDARDVASALVSLAAKGRAGTIYNVGTGRSHRVGAGLVRLIDLSGRAVVVEAPGGSQAPASLDCRADIRRITADTGWRPSISWEQSLADLWDEMRAGRSLALTASSAPV